MTEPRRDDERILTVTTREDEAGERLDRVLAARLGDLSRTRLKRLVEAGRVSLDGATISDPALRVRPGQSFTVAVPPPVDDRPVPQPLALDIRFEDEHVIVIDKPAGLVVHPAPGNPDRTLVNALLAHCGDSLAGIGGVRRPGIVHRLDKDTSGLMVVAKSDAAHARLAADFAARRIERAYQALVWGVPSPLVGEIAAPIGRSPRDRKKMAVVSRGGKDAVTRYRVLRAFGTTAASVECRLATGRTHQIRVHLSARGHALVGDQTYGGGRGRVRHALAAGPARDAIAAFPRQALHAYLLGFVHPATGAALSFESPLPPDMIELTKFLEQL
jgi:23S rRNA pseudouridine1911/1915/1917 synthase